MRTWIFKRLLKWYKTRLERQMKSDFDRGLSHKLDAVSILLER